MYIYYKHKGEYPYIYLIQSSKSAEVSGAKVKDVDAHKKNLYIIIKDSNKEKPEQIRH